MGTDFKCKHFACLYMTNKIQTRYGGCKHGKYKKCTDPNGDCAYRGWCEKANDWVHNLSGCPVNQKTEDE